MKTINKKILLTLITGLAGLPLNGHNFHRTKNISHSIQKQSGRRQRFTKKEPLQVNQAATVTHTPAVSHLSKLTKNMLEDIHQWLPAPDAAHFMQTSTHIRESAEQDGSGSITAVINKYPQAKVARNKQNVLNDALLKAIEAGNDDDANVIARHGGRIEHYLCAISLYNTQVTDQGLQRLAASTNLYSLDLTGCTQITDQGLQHLAASTNLQRLNLSGCTGITDQGLQHLEALTILEELNLIDCTGITGQGLQHLAASTRLYKLDLTGCTQITDQGLQHLAALTYLGCLDLTGCTQITDQGLQHLASSTSLYELDLTGCTQITDQGLQHLASSTSLYKLYLMGCTQITDQGLQHLAQSTRHWMLNLTGCTGITDGAIEAFKRAKPDWNVIN